MRDSHTQACAASGATSKERCEGSNGFAGWTTTGRGRAAQGTPPRNSSHAFAGWATTTENALRVATTRVRRKPPAASVAAHCAAVRSRECCATSMLRSCRPRWYTPSQNSFAITVCDPQRVAPRRRQRGCWSCSYLFAAQLASLQQALMGACSVAR